MSFFEQIGRKITDAGQEVANQTRSLAETTKLNSGISETEKKLNAIYQEIGRRYCQVYSHDIAPEFSGLVHQVDELQGNIVQMRERVKYLKGVEKCSQCGADVPASAQFCNNCGNRMVRKTAGRVCHVCGNALSSGAMFCETCGTKCEEKGREIPFPGTAKKSERRCRTCGAEIGAGMLFCVECGTRYEEKGGYDSVREEKFAVTSKEAAAAEEYAIAEPQIAEAGETAHGRNCRKCGAELADGMSFCVQCGTKYEEDPSDAVVEAISAVVSEKATVEEYAIAEPQTAEVGGTAHGRNCRKCGAKLADGMRFCTVCGTRAQETMES